MNIDKYINMSKEEFLEFLNLDYLIPIDDVVEYKGIKYQLPPEVFYENIACHRLNCGYCIDFSEKINIDIAQRINGSTISGIKVLVEIIESDLSNNLSVRYKKIEWKISFYFYFF